MGKVPRGYALCKSCQTIFKHNWKGKSRLCPICKAIEDEDLENRRNIQKEFDKKRVERSRAQTADEAFPPPRKRGRPRKVKEINSAAEFATADLTSRAVLADRCGMSYGKLCGYVRAWGVLPPIRKSYE